ncbi:outer membrane receptor protein [Caulobacter sp. AP07]|nr:outer membrane receptor protein [Caulobacter sp. AP07]
MFYSRHTKSVALALLLCTSHAALAHAAGPAVAAAQDQPAAPAAGQKDDVTWLPDVIVTATRRSTNVQEVPIAVSAIGGEALAARGITDPRQLSNLAPNLMVDQGLGGGQTHVSIRGQTSTSFALEASSPAALYLDDVYQVSQFGVGTQVFDLDRIEVLRGPQGTLFGKNTTAGSVNYFSAAPKFKDEGYITLDAAGGDYRRYSLEGMFNKAISDTLAVRASGRIDHRGSYVDNLYDGSKLGEYTSYNGRVIVAWRPTDDTQVSLKVYALKSNGDGPVYIARGYFGDPCSNPGVAGYFGCNASGQPSPISRDSRKTYSEVPTYEKWDNYGATLKIEQSLGDYVLTSITGAQSGHYKAATNDDGLGSDFFHSHQTGFQTQASQELRLATPVTKPLRAVLGLYYQYDRIRAVQGSLSTRSPQPDQYVQMNDGTSATSTSAAFGSVTFDVSKQFSLIGGLRYSHERKKASNFRALRLFNFANPGRVIDDRYFDMGYGLARYEPLLGDTFETFYGADTWNKLTWDATANYKPTDDLLIYAKIGTGFRSGGFFPAPAGSASEYVSLSPETVTSREIGFKSEWAGGRLRVNGDVYKADYKDMQIQTANQNTSGLGFSNASSASIKGAELEVEAALAERLILSTSVGYNKAVYNDYLTLVAGLPVNLSGNPLPYAPSWTSNVALSYSFPVGNGRDIGLRTDWSYRSKYAFDSFNVAVTQDPSRTIGNARITYGPETGTWELAAYVDNITDHDQRVFTFNQTYVAPTIYGPRRTWGVQANYRF